MLAFFVLDIFSMCVRLISPVKGILSLVVGRVIVVAKAVKEIVRGG